MVTVGAVVTTKNSELTLFNCLASIFMQTSKFDDVVIVDNFSKDGTSKIISNFGYRFLQHGPERSHQRNLGVSNLKNCDYVLIVDSDMIMHQQLNEKIKVLLLKNNSIGLFIPEVIVGKKIFTKIRNYERPYYDASPIDAVRVINTKYFKKVNGYDEKLFINGSGEDWDLDLKLKKFGEFGMLPREKSENCNSIKFVAENTDSRLISTVGLYHDESKLTMFKYCAKKAYYSNTFKTYKKKWNGQKEIIYQFSWINRLFKIFFRKHNYCFTLKNFHLYICFLFYRCILILYLLFYKLSKKIKINDDIY